MIEIYNVYYLEQDSQGYWAAGLTRLELGKIPEWLTPNRMITKLILNARLKK
jgi:hypothetical protein